MDRYAGATTRLAPSSRRITPPCGGTWTPSAAPSCRDPQLPRRAHRPRDGAGEPRRAQDYPRAGAPAFRHRDGGAGGRLREQHPACLFRRQHRKLAHRQGRHDAPSRGRRGRAVPGRRPAREPGRWRAAPPRGPGRHAAGGPRRPADRDRQRVADVRVQPPRRPAAARPRRAGRHRHQVVARPRAARRFPQGAAVPDDRQGPDRGRGDLGGRGFRGGAGGGREPGRARDHQEGDVRGVAPAGPAGWPGCGDVA